MQLVERSNFSCPLCKEDFASNIEEGGRQRSSLRRERGERGELTEERRRQAGLFPLGRLPYGGDALDEGSDIQHNDALFPHPLGIDVYICR